MNGVRQEMIVKTKNDKGIFCFSKITGAQIRSQYNEQCKRNVNLSWTKGADSFSRYMRKIKFNFVLKCQPIFFVFKFKKRETNYIEYALKLSSVFKLKFIFTAWAVEILMFSDRYFIF